MCNETYQDHSLLNNIELLFCDDNAGDMGLVNADYMMSGKGADRFVALYIIEEAVQQKKRVDPKLREKLPRMFDQQKEARGTRAVKRVKLEEVSDLLQQELDKNDGSTDRIVLQAALLADDQWIKEECARRAESQRKSEVKQRINI